MFLCDDTEMLSITVAVVSVILVGKDIVGKKVSDVRVSIYFSNFVIVKQ